MLGLEPPARARRSTRTDGFALVELVVTMAVLGFLAAAFAVVLGSVVRHSSSTQDSAVLQTEARAALDRLASDLRQAYTGDDATYPIESVSGTVIQFLSPDRQTPFHLRRVAYRLSGGRFERAEATSSDTDGAPWVIPSLGSWTPLVDRVTTSAPFTSLDANGSVTTNPSLVRTIRVQLSLSTTTGRTSTYSADVTVRADV